MKLPMSLASLGLLGALVAGCGSDATTGGAGGASSAGATNGGASTAGTSSGGASNGGASSAGTSSGGTSKGGASNAGASNAGAPSGGASGAGSVDPKNCAAVGAFQKKLVIALSCKDDSEQIKEYCGVFYSVMRCTSEWEALIGCMGTKPTSDFECDSTNNEVDLKSGVCTAEKAAFGTCIE